MLKHRRLLPPRPKAWAFLPCYHAALFVAAGDDNAAPVFSSAEAGDASNLIVAVRFSEPIVSPGADYLAGSTLQIAAVSVTPASAALQPDQQTIYFTLTSGDEALPLQAITWEYSDTTGDLEDLAGNVLAGVAAQSVANNVGEHWRFDHPANTMQLAAL
jgi:hypothetical protein